MIPQSKGKIFLSEERGYQELDWFRSYNTFNFGKYLHEHKTAIGPLYVLNDDTLAGGRNFSLVVEEDTDILLVPVVGAVAWKDSTGTDCVVEAGQCRLQRVSAGTTIEWGNPYEAELVNFLHLWFKHSSPPWLASSQTIPSFPATGPQQSSFDLNNHKDKLIELPTGQESTAPVNRLFGKQFIGKFAGRTEITHTITPPYNGLFVFVIEGAFEVQYRLLHARDGLALWDLQEVEFEALSNDAIILVTEIAI